MLATNLLSRHRGVDASLARLRVAFGGEVQALPAAKSGNVVVLASRGAPLELDAGTLTARARALRESTGLDLGATLAQLEREGSLRVGRR
jgi:spermidine synthase